MFEEKGKQYGHSYEDFGKLMQILLPEYNFSIDEWNRLGLIVMKVTKLYRYCNNISFGGHQDSADDDIVYSAMLASLTSERTL